MKKIAITALASLFFFVSPASMASGGESSGITHISAEDMANYLRCKTVKSGGSVKSATRVVNGKIPVVKCADANKIVNDARAKDAR